MARKARNMSLEHIFCCLKGVFGLTWLSEGEVFVGIAALRM